MENKYIKVFIIMLILTIGMVELPVAASKDGDIVSSLVTEREIYPLIPEITEGDIISRPVTEIDKFDPTIEETKEIISPKLDLEIYPSNNLLYFFNESYYMFFMPEQGSTWQEAKEYCQSLNGHLVTITSESEQLLIDTLVTTISSDKQLFWIGLYKANNQWAWVTNETVSYTNWANNEPSNHNNNESYVHIFSIDYRTKKVGEWNDAANDGAEYAGEIYALSNYGFICEWDESDLVTEKLQSPISECNIVYIIDKETGLPLENATVQHGSTIVLSDTSGKAVFSDTITETGLTVSFDNYATYEDPDFSFSTGNPIEYIQLEKQSSETTVSKPVIIPISCNGTLLGTGTAQINNQISLMANIIVRGVAPGGVKQFILKQGDIILGTSIDGTFEISNKKFQKDVPVVVTLEEINGKTTSEVLNISVVSFSMTPTSLPILGNIDIKIPDTATLLGGLNISVEILDIPVEADITNEEIKIGFNATVKEKDLSKLNSGLRKWMDAHNRKTPSAKFQFDVSGYVVFKMGKSGVEETVSKIVLMASYKNGFAKTYIVPVAAITVPVRVEIEFGVNGEATIKNIGYDWENAEWLMPGLDMKISGNLTGSGGIGASMASVGVYGKVGIGFDFAILPDFYVKEITGNGELGVYGELDLGFWAKRGEAPIVKGDMVFYKNANTYEAEPMALSLYEEEFYTINDRSYLSTASAFSASPLTQSPDGQSYTTMQTSTYDGADPQIVTANDITLLAYLRDNGGTDTHNFQQLVYSVWNDAEQTWSEPIPVDNNTLVDADFHLAADENNIWIAYTEANRALSEADTLADTASVFEIVAAHFDGTGFTDFSTLTNNSSYDSSPVLSVADDSVSVAWLTNSDNDVFGMTGENTISLATYDGTWNITEVISGVSTVTGLDLGIYDNNLTIAAVHDTDSDLNTSDDRILVTYTNGMETELSAAAFIDCPTVTPGAIVWYENNNIRSSASSEPLLTLSADCSSGFQLTDNAILFTVHNTEGENGGSDIWGSFLNPNGTYGTPTRLTRTDGYVDSFGAVPYHGGFLIPYRLTNVTFTEDSFTTVSNLCSMIYAQNYDLRLDSVYFDLDDLTDDGNVTFTAWITNTGALDVTNPDLLVDTVPVDTIAQTIPAGETVEVTFTYSLPVDTASMTLTIAATDEVYLADNTQVLQLAYADVSITTEQRIIANKDYLLLTLVNRGSATGSGTMTIYENDADGTVILSEAYSLEAGQSTYALYSMEDIRFDGYQDSLMYAEAETEQEDYNTGNNSDTVKMASFQKYMLGDVNEDGYVTSKDRMILSRHLAEWSGYELDTIHVDAADVNCDGEITSLDRLHLSRHVAGWDGYLTLPVQIDD